MKCLYRFNLDYGRMGSLTGLFVASPEKIKNLIGKEVYFGEVLGKHSDVFSIMEESDFKLLTDDQDFISKFIQFDCESGINPFHYMEDEDEDE